MARHTRWPAGKDWLPEAFRQLGANTNEYQEPTPQEEVNQWIRMHVDRKISITAMIDALEPLRDHVDQGVYDIINNVYDEELRRELLTPYARRVWS